MSNLPRLLVPFGLQHTLTPLQHPIHRSCSSLLDFLVPYLRFNVQSTVYPPLPQKGVEFFAPLRSAQSRGPPDLVRPCPKNRLRHVLSINMTPLWSIGKRERRSSRFLTPFFYGPEGSRTPVRKPIPCSSTIIVDCLTFPPVHGNQHPCTFSSFMIRPASQSFDTVVSYMFEAWVLKCRCFKSDCCN